MSLTEGCIVLEDCLGIIEGDVWMGGWEEWTKRFGEREVEVLSGEVFEWEIDSEIEEEFRDVTGLRGIVWSATRETSLCSE